MNSRFYTFIGGISGPWQVTAMRTLTGEPLAPVEKLNIIGSQEFLERRGAAWLLSGITSYDRYLTRCEKALLAAKQPDLGRPEAVCAALIPIRKNAAWWNLTQEERREILETRSRHIQTGLNYLPAIARRLYHCRDLSENEPFDFLTWFEFAPGDASLFDDLTAELRASREWSYVEREVDIRLIRVHPA
ncbi:chlorite dismutase family protein [Methylosarcina fibrata]|uniref:chlorite dismutase family protein n=1 Tax=Methylosarcina fibrata TaxID=105972 RepID=UPI00037D1CF8|nr:chlorite dismutase family protein [Methylosarcina fibrata]